MKKLHIRAPTLIRKGWNDQYDIYLFSLKEWVFVLGEAALLSGLISYLFYKSLFACLLFLPFCPVLIRRKKEQKKKKRKEKLRDGFRECLQSVAGALNAGYSMENAWKDAEADMIRFLGEEHDMTKELRRMNRRVALNTPLEQLLLDFAERSQIEDVQNFCQVFQFAKRGGGDLTSIIQNTYMRIADKTELEREIETAMAAKKMEQKIMSLMPMLILLYIGLTSPDFLSAMYHNTVGIIVMTICLALYGVSVLLGEKIVRIRV